MNLLKRPPEDYLRHRFGPGATLVAFEKFPRGSSRETWFVSYRSSPQAEVQHITFRADFPSGSTIPTPLAQEYFVYERLGRTNVPVAKALWWEEDPTWTHRPFFAREKIEGNWELPDFLNPDPKFDDYKIEISKEHMRKLALVHNVDWKGLGFGEWLPPPSGPDDCGANCVRMMSEQLESFRKEPLPIFIAAAKWLRERAPRAPRLSLCKGTNGLGEEVFRDNKIVAMSDWEEASIGDPANDFAHMQNFVPVIERDGRSLWGLPQALDYYRSVGGADVTVESVQYYGVIRALRMVVFGHRVATSVHAEEEANIRQAWTGTEVLNVGKRIVAAAIGIGPPVVMDRLLELNETVV